MLEFIGRGGEVQEVLNHGYQGTSNISVQT